MVPGFRAADLVVVAAVVAAGLAAAVVVDTTALVVAVERLELAELAAFSGLLAAATVAMAAMVSVELAASPLPTIKRIHMSASVGVLGAARRLQVALREQEVLGAVAAVAAVATMPLPALLESLIFKACVQETV